MTTEQSNPSGKVEDQHSFFGIASLLSGLMAFLFLLLDFGPFYFMIYIDPSSTTIPFPLLDGNFLLFANSLPVPD